jgi:hypothetical protein
MGSVFNLFYPWGLILYAVALVHFFRRRPDGYWLWIILIVPFGALIYIVVEVIPDLGLLRDTFQTFPRRKRIRYLEAMITQNPAPGNLEDLAGLYLDEQDYKRAAEYYDRAIASSRTPSDDAFYRRGITKVHLENYAGALPDLEYIVSRDRKYDSYRAMGLLAHVYAQTGQPEQAEACFEEATTISTLSETYLNYAQFLASQNRIGEAREWAQKVLQKKPAMPTYLRRRERPWFRKANALLKKLPAT